MIKRFKKEMAAFVAVVMMLSSIHVYAGTDTEIGEKGLAESATLSLQPQKSSNLDRQNYGKYAVPVYSYLVPLEDGYMRVEYVYESEYVLKAGKDGSGGADDFEWVVTEGLFAEYYDEAYKLTSRVNIDISNELPEFAGFYAGSDGYYVAYAQDLQEYDKDGNDVFDINEEYMRIVKYDKNWNRKCASNITNYCGVNEIDGQSYDIVTDVAKPLEGGSLRMEEYNGHLYVHTCYEEKGTYSNGTYYKGHQMTLILDLFTDDLSMSLKPTRNDMLYSWVSHSFNQYVLADEGALVTLNHGDGYQSRGAVLGKYKIPSNDTEMPEPYGEILTMSWYGPAGENYTGASLGGLEKSGTSYLVAGNTVIQDESYKKNKTRNVFLTATSKEAVSEEHTVNYMLTDYEEGEEYSASTPQLVKYDDNCFLVIWRRLASDSFSLYDEFSAGDICYVFVDGSGKAISETYTVKGELTDCRPVQKDGKAVWYSSGEEGVIFYNISKDGSYEAIPVNGLNVPVLTEIETTTDGTYLEWEAVEGADGYEIFRIDETNENASTIEGQYFKVTGGKVSYTDGDTYFDGKKYNYLVYAYNDTVRSYGTEWNKIQVVKAPYPYLANDASGVTVSWSKVTNAIGYKVYRYVSGEENPKKEVTITDGAVTSYKDTEVVSGQTYVYRLRTIKEGVCSPLSVENSVKYIPMAKLSLKNYNSGTYAGVMLSWDRRDSSMRYYIYKWCDDLKQDMGVWSPVTESSSYIDEEVVEGFTYTYTFVVSDNKGNSSASAKKTIKYVKPEAEAPTSSKKPVESSTPGEEAEESSVPSGKPEESSVPSGKPEESNVPSERPEESSVPSGKPEESSVPSGKPEESSVPSERPEESSTPGEKPSGSAGTGGETMESEMASQKPEIFPAPVFTDLRHVFYDTQLSWSVIDGADGYVVIYYDTANRSEQSAEVVEGNTNTVFLQRKGITNAIYGYRVQAYKWEGGTMLLGTSSREITFEFIKPASLQSGTGSTPESSKAPLESSKEPAESKTPGVEGETGSKPVNSDVPAGTGVEEESPAPGTGESPTPGTGESPAPGTEESSAPGIGESPAPGTEESLAPGETEFGKPGDVDGDGFVRLNDAQLALRAALMLETLSLQAKWAADMNQNQKVELRDAQKILRMALMLE